MLARISLPLGLHSISSALCQALARVKVRGVLAADRGRVPNGASPRASLCLTGEKDEVDSRRENGLETGDQLKSSLENRAY